MARTPFTTRTVARTLGCAGTGVGLLLGGCAPAGPGAEGNHPERLDGRWSVEFRLDEGPSPRRELGPGATVTGELALLANRHERRLPGLGGVPSQYGAFSADFTPFGLPAQPQGRVPTAVARLLGRDSVAIALDAHDGLGTYLSGILRGDSVTGRWWSERERWSGANGRFVMRRR